MKKYAVSYINFFNNELTIEIVEAETIKKAILKHSKLLAENSDNGKVDEEDWLHTNMPEELEEIKETFFDMDCMVDVVEII